MPKDGVSKIFSMPTQSYNVCAHTDSLGVLFPEAPARNLVPNGNVPTALDNLADTAVQKVKEFAIDEESCDHPGKRTSMR